MKDIERSFDAGVEKINDMKKQIEVLKTKTNQLINQVKGDYDKLIKIQELLIFSQSSGKAIEKTFFFFTVFKKQVIELDDLCQKFLDQYNSNGKKRQLN